jgi:hypothetical protein
VPSEYETVISQLARSALGGTGVPYLCVIGATTVILAMATNTSFAGFPRLSALMAMDGFLPRPLTYRGSRLVYSRGIISLALIAALWPGARYRSRRCLLDDFSSSLGFDRALLFRDSNSALSRSFKAVKSRIAA